MQLKIVKLATRLGFPLLFIFGLVSCQKSISGNEMPLQATRSTETANAGTPASPPFNLEVILRGDNGAFGHVKFRQDNDAEKIVTLDTWVRDLAPNHEYKLQRAVDTNIDDNCTSTAWLTLGEGSTPQSIYTDATGTGRAGLWRDLSAVSSGSTFDIHFRVIDAATSAVVLTSDCYQFVVR
ncbi:hypothetical protein [Flavisolibacter nicotianae]|uniref:hypothetical protein n=1 Tax=Flavisolibacter nicotianae TaxID=2364882 RepID=UPI000EB505FC|nr:hypothetical protein [Flavisolibacter nicotianae]